MTTNEKQSKQIRLNLRRNGNMEVIQKSATPLLMKKTGKVVVRALHHTNHYYDASGLVNYNFLMKDNTKSWDLHHA